MVACQILLFRKLRIQKKSRFRVPERAPLKIRLVPLLLDKVVHRAAGQEGFTNNYRVYFTGLVTGRREPRILVNGLPCQSAPVSHSVKADQPVLINCHGVLDDAVRLTVSIASGILWVTDSAGRVHQLLPGEGM